MAGRTHSDPSPKLGARLLPTLSTLAVAGLLSAAAIAPSAATSYTAPDARAAHSTQELDRLDGVASAAPGREGFSSEAPPPPPPAVASIRMAPAAGIPDPDTAMAIGYQMVADWGWGPAEFDCLAALWNRESRWDVYAHNPTSGAYGIPQAYPGEKMASVGADWQTNPVTQITWGLGYIAGRYGAPCGAWEHSEQRGWY